MAARLTLLEIINSDRLRIYRSEYFPLIQALAGSRGVPSRWLSLGIEARTAASGANLYLYDPPADDLDAAAAALTDSAPTHVILNERLTEGAFRRLRAAAPEARFHLLPMSASCRVIELLEGWLGLDLGDLRGDGLLLEEAVRPDFRKTPLNDLARTIRPYPSLLLGPACDYSRSLAEHPDFASLDAATRSHRGCSFCFNPDPKEFRPRTDPVALAMEQLAGAAETLDTDLQDRSFLVRGVNLLPRVEDLAAALEEAGAPPTTFFISTRVDRVLRLVDRLRNALPVLERRGHRLLIWNMGIENWSPRENERLNKGLSPDVLREGTLAARRLAEDFPGVFGFGGWGYILYTPWTDLEDLRVNLRELRNPGSGGDEGFALGTALQLLPGLPVTRLAEADGLLTDRFEDLPTDSGCITTWDGYELPWRFADPRVARMYLLTRRLLPRGVIPEDDPVLVTMRAWISTLPSELRRDFIAISEALLDVVEGELHLPDERAHLEAAGRLLEERSPNIHTAAPSPEDSPEQIRILEALRADLQADTLPLGTLSITALRLRSTDTGGRIELILTGGPEPLEVLIERASESEPAFLRSGHLALSYKSRRPGPAEDELRAMEALLAHAARHSDRG